MVRSAQQSARIETSASPESPRRIAVVVPTHNRKEGLRRCLLGLLACDVAGFDVEIHVVDDGSMDGTPRLFREVCDAYRGPVRLRYHRQPQQGAAAARNLGLQAAALDHVFFIDDDCVPQPDWIRALAETPWSEELAAVGGRIVSPEKGGVVSRYCRYVRFNEFPPDDGVIDFVNTANCVLRAGPCLDLGGFERLFTGAGGEDHELSQRLVLAGYRIGYEPAAVVRHYHRESAFLLLRAFHRRGRANTLRHALLRREHGFNARRCRREARRLARYALGALRIPWDALRLIRAGVPVRDAFPFALLEWATRLSWRWGKLAMMREILHGRQSLARTSRMPQARGESAPTGDPGE